MLKVICDISPKNQYALQLDYVAFITASCLVPLGLESGAIWDSQIETSSFKWDTGPSHMHYSGLSSRLNHVYNSTNPYFGVGWRPAYVPYSEEWLQV